MLSIPLGNSAPAVNVRETSRKLLSPKVYCLPKSSGFLKCLCFIKTLFPQRKLELVGKTQPH